MRNCVLVFATISLAGCMAQANTGQVEDPQVWGRVDCRRQEGNPEVQMLAEQAKAICSSRAQAAAISGTTAIPVGHGLGGAIASGIERGQAQSEISNATAMSCMAEQGYLLRTKSAHIAACDAIQAQKDRQASSAAAKDKKR